MYPAVSAPVVKIFWPRITQSSPSRVARVDRWPRSDPASGSESPIATRRRPAAISGSSSFFCSSVP
ncbi:MAG: hypothetical protein M5U14_09955 [Acidimicrobiia bacterium]|nr:hypothetical protein [Acidimicrobiia bacterium]